MKLLFVTGTLGSGGKERRLTELMKSFKLLRDIEFELAVMSKDIHYTEIFDLDIKIHFILRKTKKDISVFNKFYKLCSNVKPDIVHCWDSMTAIYLVPACKLLHIKLVNGMVINSPLQRNVFNKDWLRARITFPFSDIIVGNSKAGLTAYKAQEEKSMVIYNGFNFNRISNLASKATIRKNINSNSNFIVGMVATFYKKKDYKTFFRAAQLILSKRKDITFLAIGNGTDSAEACHLIEPQYAENFRLLGLKAEIESFINVMDICVLSTFTEGISNAILEYMALGKPVVATTGGGTAELVINEETGFLIGPSDPEGFASKLEQLLDDAGLREKMGKAGRERVEKDFSMDQMVQKYFDLYSGIMKH